MLLYAASMRGGGIFGFDDREKNESELTLFVVVLHLYKKKDNRLMI